MICCASSSRTRLFACWLLLWPLWSSAVFGAPNRIDFNRDVRPILSDHCFACHGFDEAKRKGGLRLDLKEQALRGGKSGKPALLPGDAAQSELVRRIVTADADDHMPPAEFGKPLSPAQIAILKQWVNEGAEFKGHWAFLPPHRPSPPVVRNSDWPRNSIDQFVLARLEEKGVQPQPRAEKTTLIRRATLDLTGLPPTTEEVDQFLADRSPEAYEKVVDRLLGSARYGERMGLEWMDAARFADTHGYHIDSARDMTAWRDGVIESFNRNQPFDQFTVEQLAGDLLPNPTRAQKIASGFNRNHMINYEGGAIPEEYQTAYVLDRINTTATVWLGLTMACAQCHDHKYDPLTMRDYYRFYAFFNTVPESGLDGRNGNAVPTVQVSSEEQESRLAQLEQQSKEAEQRLKEGLPEVDAQQVEWEKSLSTPGNPPPAKPLPEAVQAAVAVEKTARTEAQRTTIRDHYRKEVSTGYRALKESADTSRRNRDQFAKSIRTSMVMGEQSEPRPTFMLVRGEYDKKGEKVSAGTPGSLPPLREGLPANRLGLARWLVSPEQPLTARVTVNRYWQMYFGLGLVKSAENFGSQGDWPTHPELLDWLAVEFMESGWNVKALQKQIVMSATYQQSSSAPREWIESDPENLLLARGPRFRLQAEFVRDLALSVSGLLNPTIGGESVFPYQPSGLWEELMSRQDGDNFTAQKYTQDRGGKLYRRSMYTFVKRTSAHPNMTTFDAPDRQVCTVRRPRTNTPLQALVLLNDPTYVEAARKLAERVILANPDERRRLEHAFRLATGRLPKAAEAEVLMRLYRDQLAAFRQNASGIDGLLKVGESPVAKGLDPAELAAWTVVTSTLLNLDETITKG
jgi:hypothetical protein